MVRKLLVTVALALLVFFLVNPQKDSILTVFQMTEEPLVISKGNYGQSVVVEISFSHDGLDEWLNSLQQPYPLLMVNADWISRSPNLIKVIKEKNIPTGLLGGNGGKDYSVELFKKDVAIYEKEFSNKPLWFMTSDYIFSNELQQVVFEEQINMLTPTVIFKEGENYKETKGAIISLQLHEESKPNFENLAKFMKSQKFLTIEENIFGYSLKTKKLP